LLRGRIKREKFQIDQTKLPHIHDIDNSTNTNFPDAELKTSIIYTIFPVAADAIDAITIHNSDLLRLEPLVYLNDNLIDFQIKYMISKLPLFRRRAIHAFSCQFYNKLLVNQHTKDAHNSVARWTSKIDLFSLDLVIIPINYSTHWSLSVVVNPKALLNICCERRKSFFTSNHNKTDDNCYIMFFDSLSLHNSASIAKTIKYYIFHEWDTRHRIKHTNLCELEYNSTTMCNTFISAMEILIVPVPLQHNGFDCGVFVIKYVECIVSNWPHLVSKDMRSQFALMFDKTNFTQNHIDAERMKYKAILEDVRTKFLISREITNTTRNIIVENLSELPRSNMTELFEILCVLDEDDGTH
jgi:Ulp1 family protease